VSRHNNDLRKRMECVHVLLLLLPTNLFRRVARKPLLDGHVHALPNSLCAVLSATRVVCTKTPSENEDRSSCAIDPSASGMIGTITSPASRTRLPREFPRYEEGVGPSVVMQVCIRVDWNWKLGNQVMVVTPCVAVPTCSTLKEMMCC
jgi:hypothetical protein